MSERVAYWRSVLERQELSGLSVRQFCEREGVSTASFYNWRRRLQRGDRTPRAGRGRGGAAVFVPVSVRASEKDAEDGTRGGCIEIVLSQGARVRVPDGASRRTLIDVLFAVREAS